MPENYRKNNVRNSRISDLSSKIREAENDLILSKGTRARNIGIGNGFRQMSRPPSDTRSRETEEVSELQILRLKQIETAQRLKETLRRNVDLMTELQKARSVVRTLEKKISILEDKRNENSVNFDDINSQKSVCSHCLKQQEEINKLKLHIVEMNDSFQKRWEETQRELSQARQSLTDVSNKLFESINTDKNNDFNNFNSNNSKITEDNYYNIHTRNPDLINVGNVNSGFIRSGTQSPSTFRFSRPTSSNIGSESNLSYINRNESIKNNIYELNNVFSNNLSNRQPEIPLISNQNLQIENQYIDQSQRSIVDGRIRSARPQSENIAKQSTFDFKSFTGSSSNIRSMQNSQRSNNFNGIYHDLTPRIPSLDSLTVRPETNNYINSLPIKSSNNHISGNLPGNLIREPFMKTSAVPTMVYPNTYSSILPSQQRNQFQMNAFNSTGNDTLSSNQLLKSSSIRDNMNYDEQLSDSHTLQNIESIPNNHLTHKSNSHSPLGFSTDNGQTLNNSSPSISYSDNRQPQIINTTSPYNETPNEYPSSPINKESQIELETEQNTYGNIRKTLEELKKTQDERVQQLKNDREKLLRAVLSDLQEMRDFQSNLTGVKEQQESLLKNAPKKLFSLDQNINIHENV